MVATRANQVGGADYTSGSLREDLANFISLVSAEKTPFISMIATNKASNPRHEWQIDTLETPTPTPQSGSFQFYAGTTAPAGIDSVATVNDTPERIANYTEVGGKQIHIEGSLLKSNPAGARNWFNYAMDKRKLELRRDFEARYVGFDQSTQANSPVYGTGTERVAAGLAAYAGVVNRLPVNSSGTTAVDIHLAPATGTATTVASTAGEALSLLAIRNGADNGYGGRAPQFTADVVDASLVDLTVDHINDTLRVVSENGGNIDTAMVPTGLKAGFSNLLIAGNGGAAQRRADEMSKRLNLSVDSVLTEFGFDVTIVHNYIQQGRQDGDKTVYLFDKSAIKRTVLQPYDFQEDMSARYGKGGIIFCEETLEVSAPNSLAMIMGVGGTDNS